MNIRTIITVFKKETIDTIRDKRSLFISVIFPVILFPLIFSVLDKNIQAVNSRVSKEVRIGLEEKNSSFVKDLLSQQQGVTIVHGDDLDKKLEKGNIYAVLRADSNNDQIKINIKYDNSRQASVTVFNFLVEIFDTLSNSFSENERTAESSFITVINDTVYEEGKGNSLLIFSTLLPFLLFVFAALSPVALASDLGAGEKERSTIEPLLSNPVSRTDILSGKFLSLILMGFVGTIAFAAGIVISTILTPEVFGIENLSVSLLSAVLLVIVSIMLTMFFSSAELTLSLLAKSPKEAQVLFLPLLMICMSVGYGTSVIDPKNIAHVYRHIPLVNISIFIKELALNIISPSTITITLIWGFLYIFLFLLAAKYLLSRESIVLKN